MKFLLSLYNTFNDGVTSLFTKIVFIFKKIVYTKFDTFEKVPLATVLNSILVHAVGVKLDPGIVLC